MVEFGPSIARKLCRASLLDLDARLPARPRREWLWRFRFNLGIYRVNIFFFATQVRLGVRAGSLFWAYLVQLRPRDSKTYVPSQHNQTRSRETMSWNLLGPSQHVQYFFADFGTCCSAKTFVYFDWSPTWHFKAIACHCSDILCRTQTTTSLDTVSNKGENIAFSYCKNSGHKPHYKPHAIVLIFKGRKCDTFSP